MKPAYDDGLGCVRGVCWGLLFELALLLTAGAGIYALVRLIGC